MKRTMPPYGDARWFLQRLREDGFEIWLTTTRPYLRLDNVDPDTREWLRRQDMTYDGLLYDEDKYRRLIDIVGLERIVLVIEDLADKYDRAEELGLPVVLINRPHNRATYRDNTVDNFREAYKLADQLRIEWRGRNAPDALRPDDVEASLRPSGFTGQYREPGTVGSDGGGTADLQQS
jgi:hypothetical protein